MPVQMGTQPFALTDDSIKPRHFDSSEFVGWTVTIPPYGAWSEDTGTFAEIIDATDVMQFLYSTTQDAVRSKKVFLIAGTYKIYSTWRTGSNCGIATIKLDTTTVGTVNTYAAATGDKQNRMTGITVSDSGYYDLKIEALTKDASSSDYRLYLNTLLIERGA